MKQSIDIEAQIRDAEISAERASSVFRLLVFAILAIAIVFASAERGFETAASSIIAIYGLGAAVGVFLAWRNIHHPLIAYGFVTFDVILVAFQVLLLAQLMGMPAANVFAMPISALIFVVLIHASMRYQPVLVAYAAGLFILSVGLGTAFYLLDTAPSGGLHQSGMPTTPHAGVSGLIVFQLLPPTLVLLAAAILFAVGVRTRNLLLKSITEAARTARLSRYFSPNLAAELSATDAPPALSSCRQTAAVLFIDIRGFTSLGETMSPSDLGAFLSEYRNRLSKPVFEHDGTIDKFIGDAIMAVFGAPKKSTDDPKRAVACAFDILEEAGRWSKQREAAGLAPVAIGIGGHYGRVFAGALGNEQLLEYTVIGDTVNVAERLEKLSRELGSPLVLSEDLIVAAGGSVNDVIWSRLPPQKLKGHTQLINAAHLAPEPSSSKVQN